VSSIAFRPRSIPELLDAAFQILRRYYGQFLVLAGCLYLPLIVAQLILRSTLGASNDQTVLAARAVATLGFYLLLVIWAIVAESAIVVAAADAYRAHEVSAANALRQVKRQFGPILAASLNKVIRVWLWSLLFLVPGVIAYLRYFAVPAVVVLEGRRGPDAMARARQLSSSEKGKVFLTWLPVLLVYFALYITVFTTAAALTGSVTVSSVASTVFSIFAYPLVGITTAVLYYDVRIRKEGYDIELMAQELGATPMEQPA
jgi:uncharacterized membrane protein